MGVWKLNFKEVFFFFIYFAKMFYVLKLHVFNGALSYSVHFKNV